MRVLDVIYETYTATGNADSEVVEWAKGIDFSEFEVTEQDFPQRDHRFIATVEGVDIWHNVRADYYAFTEEEDE